MEDDRDHFGHGCKQCLDPLASVEIDWWFIESSIVHLIIPYKAFINTSSSKQWSEHWYRVHRVGMDHHGSWKYRASLQNEYPALSFGCSSFGEDSESSPFQTAQPLSERQKQTWNSYWAPESRDSGLTIFVLVWHLLWGFPELCWMLWAWPQAAQGQQWDCSAQSQGSPAFCTPEPNVCSVPLLLLSVVLAAFISRWPKI